MTWIILWNELFKSPSINWCFHKIFSRNQCSACSIPKGNKRGLHHFTSIFMINWLLYIVKFGYNSLSTLYFVSGPRILINFYDKREISIEINYFESKFLTIIQTQSTLVNWIYLYSSLWILRWVCLFFWKHLVRLLSSSVRSIFRQNANWPRKLGQSRTSETPMVGSWSKYGGIWGI